MSPSHVMLYKLVTVSFCPCFIVLVWYQVRNRNLELPGSFHIGNRNYHQIYLKFSVKTKFWKPRFEFLNLEPDKVPKARRRIHRARSSQHSIAMEKDGSSSSYDGDEVRDPNWASRQATKLMQTHIQIQSSSSFSEPHPQIYSDDYVSADEGEWDDDHEKQELRRIQQSEWDRAASTGTASVARTTKDFFSIPHALSSESTESPRPRPQQQHFMTPLVPSQSGFTNSSNEEESRLYDTDIDDDGEDAGSEPGLFDGSSGEDYVDESHESGSRNQNASHLSRVLVHVETGRTEEEVDPSPTPPQNRQVPSESPHRQQQFGFEDDAFEGEGDLSAGVLPDVLMTMRQKIESLSMFDSDMMRLAASQIAGEDPTAIESREALKRSSQQSISASVLASLAHKRYERRRLAAMEIEKVIRGLVVLHQQTQKNELDRVRAILLLLSDDYVRSTNEDARKGGVVALAACAIGLKKANESDGQGHIISECRDLILASVIHACQDHSKRVRYYATESLFNVVKG